MASLEATGDFRIPNPVASTREQIASDALQLRDLSEKLPDLLIYTPSAETYEEVRAYYNASITQQPLAIIRPKTDAEVAAVIKEARTKEIPFSIRAGGHDNSATDVQGKNGVVIDLRGLDSAVIAEDKKSVRVGGGILGINLSRFLHQHKLLTPHGWCATVGVAGWALGGGYGYSSAFYGLGVDQILGARVVLASGQIVDTDEHPDLGWALRGAGNGNFGVVVELRVKVYPETGFLGGLLGFPDSQAVGILTKYGEFEKEVPANFSGEVSHMTIPGVGPVLAWLFIWTSEDDDLKDGWAFLQKMKGLGNPILDTVAAVDDYTFFSVFAAPTNIHWHARVRTIESLTPEAVKVIVGRGPAEGVCATVIHNAHGRALHENPEACYPLRKRHRIVNSTAGVPDAVAQAAEYERYKQWADSLMDELSDKGLALPYGYRNLGPEKDVEWVAMYGEEALARLKEVKNKFDPDNVLRTGYPRLDLL